MFVKAGGRDVRIDGRVIRIGRLDGDLFKYLHDPAPVLRDLRNGAARVDLFTFMQGLSEARPKLDYPMEMDNLAVLPVSTFEKWWTQDIGFKARNKAKQAEKKGVRTHSVDFDDSFVRGVWELYNECPVRQGKRFAHYGKSYDQVRRELSTFFDSSIFIGSFLEDTLIGFAKLTLDEDRTQAGIMHIASMIRHRDKAPTNALIAQAVRVCAEAKIPFLVYSNFAFGKKLSDSLSDFKERNGFKRVDLPRYYIPLTGLGSVAFRLGLHHRFVDYCPEAVLSKLRAARNAWYTRTLRSLMPGESSRPLAGHAE